MFYETLLTHKISVWIFLLFFIIKAILLFLNKTEALAKFTKMFKVPDMIVSALFLITGIYLWTQSGNTGTWLYVKVVMVLASIPLAVVGFKKQNKGLIFVALLLLLVAYRFAETKSLSFGRHKMENAMEMASP